MESLQKSKYQLIFGIAVFAICLLVIGYSVNTSERLNTLQRYLYDLNDDQIRIKNSLLYLKFNKIKNYDSLNRLVDEYRRDIELSIKAINALNIEKKEYLTERLNENSSRTQSKIEEFKSLDAISQNSSRYITRNLQSVSDILDTEKSKLLTLTQDLLDFNITPSPALAEKVKSNFRSLDRLSTNTASKSIQLLDRQLDNFISSRLKSDKLINSLEIELTDKFDEIIASIKSKKETTRRYSLSASIIVIGIVTLLTIQVFILGLNLKKTNMRLKHLNENLNNRVDSATKTIKKQMDELVVERDNAKSATVAKSEFLANMSHEIRTPLNGIKGMAQVLKKTALNETQKNHIATIINSTKNLAKIINDILDFSKIEAGKIEIEHIEMDLQSTIELAVDQMTIAANESMNQLVVSYEKTLPRHIYGDPTRIMQILLNILSNAVKFTDAGFINIRAKKVTKEDSDLVEISIQDSGKGIAEDKLDYIFESFSQENSSTTREHGGTGLGLAITKRLCELMGGSIEVASNLGCGSTFTCRLPLEPASAEVSTSLNHVSALIYDKNEIRSKSLQMQLSGWGASFQATATIDEFRQAIDRFEETTPPFTCVIVDVGNDTEDTVALLKQVPDHVPKLSLAELFTEQNNSTPSIFCADIQSPIKSSVLLNILASCHDVDVGLDGDSDIVEDYQFSGKVILVVDDNEVNREVADLILEDVDVKTLMAKNGAEALEILIKSDIDLILMDCQMPVLDGYDATKKIRQLADSSKKSVPIIAMTANAMAGDRENCLAAGMDDYIAKPIEDLELYEKIDRWIDKNSIDNVANKTT